MSPILTSLAMYRVTLWTMYAWPLYWNAIYQRSIKPTGDDMFTVHNYTATTHNTTYDFDFYEYHRNGMIICETPDLNIAMLLPKNKSGDVKAYMFWSIKNYFDSLGINSTVRHIGSLMFKEENRGFL